MKINLEKIQQFLLMAMAFFMVLDLNSVYTRLTRFAVPTPEICVGIMILLFFTVIFQRKLISYRTLFTLIGYFAYVLIFLIMTPKTGLLGFIVKFLILIPIAVCIFSKKPEYMIQLLRYYSKIIVVLALVSLILFPFTNVLHILPSIGDMSVHWRGDAQFHSYLGVYFNNNYSNYNDWLIRNTGIFVEAPQYGLNLIIALIYQLGIRKTPQWVDVAIIGLTICTTVSIGSIITMIIMFFVWFVGFPLNNKKLERLKRITSFALVIGGGLLVLVLVTVKMRNGNSYNIRVDDFKSGFASWLVHPWFGNGYGNSEIIKNFVGSFRSWSIRNNIIGFSNSWAMILSNGGIVLFSLYMLSIFGYFKKSGQPLDRRILIVLSVILMLTLNAFAYSIVIVMFLAMGGAVFLADTRTAQH